MNMEDASRYVEEESALHGRRRDQKVRVYPRDVAVAGGTAVLCAIVFAVIAFVVIKQDDTNTCDASPPVAPPPASRPVCADPWSALRNASYLADTRAYLRSRINSSQIDARVLQYSFEPHIAGSSRNNLLAEDTFSFFQSLDFDDVRRQKMPALLMNLTYRSLNRTDPLTGSTLEELDLNERNVVNQSAWDTALPPTNGYTGRGRVSGPLVWANYGSVEDFGNLSHVNLTGTIVVVRYGSIFRGDKVKYAQQRGAVGVVICLDPWDMARGTEFPNGPWANNETVQRGSITNNEGDPLTPTWPSELGGPTIQIEDTFNPLIMGKGMALPTIPVQPISFGNARRLLEGLGSTPLPAGWDNTGFVDLFGGGIGPGPATASLEVQRDLVVYNITNVIATMYGDTEPDRTVIIGAHRDAWTYGAADPISGHSVVLEVAQALGDLRRDYGWRPRRTIEVCSWDAEEWAIIGSNEYVETNIELLRQRAVAYLNLDIAVSGSEILTLNGSPLLQHVAEAIGTEVFLPNLKDTVASIMQPYGACGSGSDHVGFIQLAGVPVLDSAFENVSSSYEAMYHSNYDSYYWMSNFGDPGFLYHKTMAEFYGSILLYLSDSSVLPMHAEDYSLKLQEWVREYSDKAENAFADFSFMNTSLALFEAAANTHKARRDALDLLCEVTPQNVSVQYLRQVNDVSMGLERVFLGKGELESGQAWYLHVIFTPSASDSYAATTMPLIAQGLATGNATEANFAIGRIAQFVRRGSTFLNSSLVAPPWYENIP